jgi:conserved oligomeric Golgi complex subunit 2
VVLCLRRNSYSAAFFTKGLQIARSSTPVPPTEVASAETIDADNALLKQFAAAIIDIVAIERHVMKLWNEELSMMLPNDSEPSMSTRVHEDAEGLFSKSCHVCQLIIFAVAALKQVLSSVTILIPTLSGQITGILTRRACDALLPVRSIPSQFRAMQHKKMPKERSYFIPLVIRPVQMFFGIGTTEIGLGEGLKDGYLKVYATEVFEGAAQR